MDAYKIIAEHYGKEVQIIKTIEECAELIQALAKGDFENVAEEMADVKIMLAQLEYLLGNSRKVQKYTAQKLARQFDRMGIVDCPSR